MAFASWPCFFTLSLKKTYDVWYSALVIFTGGHLFKLLCKNQILFLLFLLIFSTIAFAQMTESEINRSNEILFNESKKSDLNTDDVNLLVKYLKYLQDKNLTNAAIAVKSCLSNYMELLNKEELLLLSSPFGYSYVKIENAEFNEQVFRERIRIYADVRVYELDKYSTQELVTRCFRRLTQAINHRNISYNTDLSHILTSDEMELLIKDYGLLHYLRDRINVLSVGTETRRADIFCLSVVLELTSAAPYERRSFLSENKFTEFKLEMRDFIDEEKKIDPDYENIYEKDKEYSAKFKKLEGMFKVAE